MLAYRLSALTLAFGIAAGCLLTSAPAVAQDPPDHKVAIDQAIDLGVKHLKKAQKPTGFWGDGTGAGPGKGWGVGYTALTGITLIECGVPATDPSLKRAANVVRSQAADIDSPYELALSILFLDRMKDKDGKPLDRDDKRRIQWFAGRLIAGQMPSGGWGYKVPKFSEADTTKLLNAVRKMIPPTEPDDKKPPFDLEKARQAAIAGLPGPMKELPVLFNPGPQLPADPTARKDVEKRHDPTDAITDNSNTHFAMLGVWTARKHDVPADRTLMLLNRRFRTSQGPGGTWAYDFARTGADGGVQFACVALLGIAIGHVVDPPPGVKPEADPVILKAFVALTKAVGDPAGTTQNRPKIKDVGGLYYLWAMERIAVLYDVQKLGKKDWYTWGAEILLCAQKGDGSWDEDGGYPGQAPLPNTCLALLFLRRANLTPDLSKKLPVNAAALTAKVDEKTAPPPPPPPPKVETPPEIAIAPPPHTPAPKVQPAPPTVVTPAPPQPEAETQTAAPKKESSPWLWIILGVVLLAVAGGGLFFLVAKRKKAAAAEDGEEKPKKKGKKKAKVKAEAEDEKPANTKKKVKAEVEEEEE